MMTHYKKKRFCFILVIVFLFIAMIYSQAEALSITSQPITFTGVTLNGSDQTTSGSTTAWQADATDELGGWNVTVFSTDFTSGGNSITVDNFKIRLLDEQIVLISGEAKPVSTQTTFVSLSGSPLKIASADSGTGNGIYTLTPDFQLDIPAQTYAGTYTATVTVTVNVGP